MTLAQGIVYALADIVGARHVVLPRNGHTAAIRASGSDAVVYPGSGSEVAEILRGAAACDVAVRVPGLTMLRRGTAGEITLALPRLNKVLGIDRSAMLARVQPLVPRDRIRRALSRARMQLAGAITQARGAGTVADCVLAVEAVTPAGRLVRATRGTCEQRPDVMDLLLHTSGVLCVISEITFALSPTTLGEAKE